MGRRGLRSLPHTCQMSLRTWDKNHLSAIGVEKPYYWCRVTPKQT